MTKIMKVVSLCLVMAATTLQSFGQTVIKLKRHGNVYILPCRVNGLLLDMYFDTGADDVSLSLTEAQTMIDKGYLTEADIIGKGSYRTANGDIAEGTKINIKKITFAGLEINDIAATVMHTTEAPLLFGQSAIRKLGKIQLDPEDNTLTIFKGNGRYDYSNGDNNEEVVVKNKNKNDDKPYASSEKGNKKYESDDYNTHFSTSTLSHALQLKIDRPGGANGASVAWHPVYRRYYAAQAGNFAFPMEIFDPNGKMTSSDKLETMFDVRGLWYNPTVRTLQANGYNDLGLAQYIIDSKGTPLETTKIDINASQPSIQSVGTYDATNDLLYFLDMQTVGVEPHRMKDGQVYRTIPLHLGAKTMSDARDDQDEVKYNYNESAIVYTGITGSEIGLLNVASRQIELYNVSNGLMTKVLRLPSSAPVESTLNFSFCNGIYWLYDKSARVWHGYK